MVTLCTSVQEISISNYYTVLIFTPKWMMKVQVKRSSTLE